MGVEPVAEMGAPGVQIVPALVDPIVLVVVPVVEIVQVIVGKGALVALVIVKEDAAIPVSQCVRMGVGVIAQMAVMELVRTRQRTIDRGLAGTALGGVSMAAEITRREFMQKFLVLSAAIALLGKEAVITADAAVVDNLGGGNGISMGSTAPLTSSSYLFWLDTSQGNGVMKSRASRNSSVWTPVSSVWS